MENKGFDFHSYAVDMKPENFNFIITMLIFLLLGMR